MFLFSDTVWGYSYIGCSLDFEAHRDLQGYTAPLDTSLTLEKCQDTCKAFSYFGVQVG